MPEVRPIDANALLKRLQKQQRYGSVTDSRGRAKAILELIHAPTLEVEPVRHGRWIESTSRGSCSIYCSYCGSHKETICPSEYCPTCGARMGGGADNG